MRKLLLSPYACSGGGISTLGDVPLLAAIRPAILYWDGISTVIPVSGLQPCWENAVEYLKKEGALEVANVLPSNSFTSGSFSVFASDFLQRLAAISADQSNQWSLMFPMGDQQSLVSQFAKIAGSELVTLLEPTKKQTLDPALQNALPVPPADTAWQEILEFKAKRGDELKRLQKEIDRLAVQLSGAESLQDAVRVGRDAVQDALADIDKVCSERWPTRILSTLRANVGSLAAGAIVGGGAVAASGGLTLPIVFAAGGRALLAPTIKVAVETVLPSRKVPERASPYVYAYEASRAFQKRAN